MIKLILTNYDNVNLYCDYCKRRIRIGERYIIIKEKLYNNEIVEHPYHIYCEFSNE